MIISKSLNFANIVAHHIDQLKAEYQLSHGAITVEAFRHGDASGLSFRCHSEEKQCNVYIDAATEDTTVAFGLIQAFDLNTGQATNKADIASFITDDAEVVARYVLRYFTDSVS